MAWVPLVGNALPHNIAIGTLEEGSIATVGNNLVATGAKSDGSSPPVTVECFGVETRFRFTFIDFTAAFEAAAENYEPAYIGGCTEAGGFSYTQMVNEAAPFPATTWSADVTSFTPVYEAFPVSGGGAFDGSVTYNSTVRGDDYLPAVESWTLLIEVWEEEAAGALVIFNTAYPAHDPIPNPPGSSGASGSLSFTAPDLNGRRIRLSAGIVDCTDPYGLYANFEAGTSNEQMLIGPVVEDLEQDYESSIDGDTVSISIVSAQGGGGYGAFQIQLQINTEAESDTWMSLADVPGIEYTLNSGQNKDTLDPYFMYEVAGGVDPPDEPDACFWTDIVNGVEECSEEPPPAPANLLADPANWSDENSVSPPAIWTGSAFDMNIPSVAGNEARFQLTGTVPADSVIRGTVTMPASNYYNPPFNVSYLEIRDGAYGLLASYELEDGQSYDFEFPASAGMQIKVDTYVSYFVHALITPT